MNEKLNLVEILKDCPKGTKLYSTVLGEVEFKCISFKDIYKIKIEAENGEIAGVTSTGKYRCEFSDAECTLFPSKDQRDWSKFKVSVEKFDYSTLHPFDRVLVRDSDDLSWRCNFLSQMFNHIAYCVGSYWDQMIPYNDETKHLVGTTDRPDEKYIWWKD